MYRSGKCILTYTGQTTAANRQFTWVRHNFRLVLQVDDWHFCFTHRYQCKSHQKGKIYHSQPCHSQFLFVFVFSTWGIFLECQVCHISAYAEYIYWNRPWRYFSFNGFNTELCLKLWSLEWGKRERKNVRRSQMWYWWQVSVLVSGFPLA